MLPQLSSLLIPEGVISPLISFVTILNYHIHDPKHFNCTPMEKFTSKFHSFTFCSWCVCVSVCMTMFVCVYMFQHPSSSKFLLKSCILDSFKAVSPRWFSLTDSASIFITPDGLVEHEQQVKLLVFLDLASIPAKLGSQ